MTDYEIASIVISCAALLVSVISISVQFMRQRWLSVELLHYRVVKDNYVRLKLNLINRKNRKHSISATKIHFCGNKNYVYTDESFLTAYRNDMFQEGESKFVVLYCPIFPEEDFCLTFFTDGRVTKITPKTIRKYLKENHRPQEGAPNSRKTNP